jgi:hypothetical protein
MCLKPNLIGSKSLIQSIFGLSDENVSAPSMPLSYSKDFCLLGSTCQWVKLYMWYFLAVKNSFNYFVFSIMFSNFFITFAPPLMFTTLQLFTSELLWTNKLTQQTLLDFVRLVTMGLGGFSVLFSLLESICHNLFRTVNWSVEHSVSYAYT